MNSRYSFLIRLQKETTNRQQTRNLLNFASKQYRIRTTILWPCKYVRLHLFEQR